MERRESALEILAILLSWRPWLVAWPSPSRARLLPPLSMLSRLDSAIVSSEPLVPPYPWNEWPRNGRLARVRLEHRKWSYYVAQMSPISYISTNKWMVVNIDLLKAKN